MNLLKRLKKMKGFTLIELLAVLVVLALIFLVVVPTVSNVMDQVRKSTFESSIVSLMKIADNECVMRNTNGIETAVTYTFENGIQSVEPAGFSMLEFKGEVPENGYIEVAANCEIDISVNNGSFYVETDVNGDLKDAIVYVPPYVGPWIFEVTTTVDNEDFSLGVENANLVIDWGDGSNNTYTYVGRDYITHQYATAGIYDVTVTGTATHITFCAFDTTTCEATNLLLSDIKTPISADFGLNSAAYMFSSTDVPSTTATDFFDYVIPGITDIEGIFMFSEFDQDINSWDTSNVINMRRAFALCYFTQDLSNWDTSSVTNMSGMFGVSSFNHGISGWDTSNVTDMSGMFSISSFNHDISGWDTSKVTNMSRMFEHTTFNYDISGWNTSSVTNMSSMFLGGSFNQNINTWDTSNVTNMTEMFRDTTAFNQDLSDWCTTSLTTSPPTNFDLNATSWVLPRPVWGTCPQ